eukprot:4904830-Pleurochrysis_carterae.AAC.6
MCSIRGNGCSRNTTDCEKQFVLSIAFNTQVAAVLEPRSSRSLSRYNMMRGVMLNGVCRCGRLPAGLRPRNFVLNSSLDACRYPPNARAQVTNCFWRESGTCPKTQQILAGFCYLIGSKSSALTHVHYAQLKPSTKIVSQPSEPRQRATSLAKHVFRTYANRELRVSVGVVRSVFDFIMSSAGGSQHTAVIHI